MIKGIFAYLFSIIILFFIFRNVITLEQISLIKKVYWLDFVEVFVLAVILFFISGVQFSLLIGQVSGKRLRWLDKLGFPIARNLWGYIIPIQGGLIYTALFLKFKYSIQLTKAISVSFYILFVNLFLCGSVGIFIYYTGKNTTANFYLLLMSLLMISCPFLIFIINYFLSRFIRDDKTGYFWLLLNNILKITKDLKLLGGKVIFLIKIIVINIIHVLVSSLWFLKISQLLGINVSFLGTILFSFILKISLVFRLTPGNLGIEQLVAMAAFSSLGYSLSDGVLISVYGKLITITIAILGGVLFTISNSKYFNPKLVFLKFNKNKV